MTVLQLEKICRVYNYADDNTLTYANKDRTLVQNTLEHALNVSLEWFKGNFMVANPTKFQAMILGQPDIQMQINVQGRDICMQTSVKLLGISIDSNLTFYDHVAKVCRKAAMQINIMKRLGKYLDFNGRLKIYDSFFLPNFQILITVHLCIIRCMLAMRTKLKDWTNEC